MTTPELSVVLTTREGWEPVARTVRCLAAQTVAGRMELVLVSLATGRESQSKLVGLTFATLQEPYTALAGTRNTVAIQIVASVIVSGAILMLWWYFA